MKVSGIAPLIHLESVFVLLGLSIVAWIFYKILLKRVSATRHTSMRHRFVVLFSWCVISLCMSLLHRFLPMTGITLLAVGAVVVVLTRLAQIYLYLYLFRVNMSSGVPRLMVNLFTLVFVCILSGWLVSEVFGLNLGPILATSAAFSLVLGLALQDTLGNLFSGVALQLDRAYVLGDWIEVQNGAQKWVGKVHEITWRATLLLGFSDELVLIPNRTIAQSQVTLFSLSRRAVRRGQAFRFGFGAPEETVREILLGSLRGVPNTLTAPEPLVLITETGESWAVYKLFYSIDDVDMQYRIADKIHSRVFAAAKAAGIQLAVPRIEVLSEVVQPVS